MNTTTPYRQLLKRSPAFTKLSLALALSLFGDWVGLLAVFSLLGKDSEGVAAPFAILLILKQLPIIMFSMWGGKLADRFSKTGLMVFADYGRAVLILVIVFFPIPEVIYPVIFLQSVFAAIFEPARSSIIPFIVHRDDLPTANGIVSVIWSTMLICGASIGGGLIEVIGVQGCLLVDVASYVLSAALVQRLSVDQLRPSSAIVSKHGFGFLKANRVLQVIISLKAVYGLGAAMYLILSVIGRESFHMGTTGTAGISILYVCRGVGALAGPLVALRLLGAKASVVPRIILLGFLMAAAGYIGVGTASSLWLSAIWTMIGHAGGSLVFVYSTTLLQRVTEDEYRGRAAGLEMTGFFASSTISQIVFGYLMGAHYITSHQAAMSCGVIWIFCFLLYFSLFSHLGIFREQPQREIKSEI